MLKENYDKDSVVSYFTPPMSVSDKNSDKDIKLYPNPTDDIITIELSMEKYYPKFTEIEILSSTGVRMLKTNSPINEDRKVIYRFSAKDLGLSSGIYFVRFHVGNEIRTVPFCVVR